MRVDIDEATLKKMAEATGGQYFRATDTDSLTQIYAQIDKFEKSTVELTKYRQYRDLFPYFLIAGFGLLSAEIILSQTIWRKIP